MAYSPDQLDKMLIPFFTIKKSGSGIGLTLSRYILQLLHDVIQVKSIPEEETVVTIIL